MLIVLAFAGAIWAAGRLLGWPAAARGLLLALLYVVVLALLAILPPDHPARAWLGGGMGQWLVLGAAGALVYAYARLVGRLRRAAVPAPLPAEKPSSPDLQRYARHILLREVGGPGQKRLGAAHVLVVGAGGIGAPLLLYLAGAGVGRITLVDDDRVSLSNLQRQIIFVTADAGRRKAEAAAERMAALNPGVRVEALAARLDAGLAARLIPGHDLVVDGSDSFATRALVNAACVAAGVPLLSAAVTQWEGQVTLCDPARGAPCLACLFPVEPAPGLAPSCAEAGVAGPLPGVIGTMAALEAVKELTGAGTSLRGRLLLYDGLHGETRQVNLRRDPACPVCGGLESGAPRA